MWEEEYEEELFCEVAGVPLTNNPAERALRHAVIMRKVQLGTQSQEGNRWIERICSVKKRLIERVAVMGVFPRTYLPAGDGPHRRQDPRA